MEGKGIHQIPPPGERLSRGRELQPGHVDDRPGRGMLTGNPLGIVEHQRPGAHRNLEVGMDDLLRRARGVHFDADGFAQAVCAACAFRTADARATHRSRRIAVRRKISGIELPSIHLQRI